MEHIGAQDYSMKLFFGQLTSNWFFIPTLILSFTGLGIGIGMLRARPWANVCWLVLTAILFAMGIWGVFMDSGIKECAKVFWHGTVFFISLRILWPRIHIDKTPDKIVQQTSLRSSADD